MPRKKVTILGSTGSVGRSSVDTIKKNLDKFEVVGISGYKNIDLLIEQSNLLNPKYIAVPDFNSYKILKKTFPFCEILCGEDATVDLAKIQSDITISAISGMEGLAPTYNALQVGNIVALANKESVVTAGKFLNTKNIIPIDSEHNALYQILNSSNSDVQSIVLTMSGGPFLNTEITSSITKEMALIHPKWKMGKKISIDSATGMNKGLEVIEAHHLFNIDYKNIEILIHPESIVHGMVKYIDGSIIFHAAVTDMKTPIAYALFYPSRFDDVNLQIDLTNIGSLNFLKPNLKKFKCLDIALNATDKPILLNAANDIAVEMFLNNELNFTQIPEFIEEALIQHDDEKTNSVEEVLDVYKNYKEEIYTKTFKESFHKKIYA